MTSSSSLCIIDETLQSALAQALWSCKSCADHQQGQPSSAIPCLCGRKDQLQRYWQYYTAVVSGYVNDAASPSRILKTHEDIFASISILRSHPHCTRNDFCNLAFPQRHGGNNQTTTHDDLPFLQATSVIVKVLVMTEPSPLHYLSDRLEKGTYRVGWKHNVPFSQYMRDIFPIQEHPVLSHADHERFPDYKTALRATNLKDLGISIRATHDIQNHFYFDRGENVVEIFHYTGFIKEQLRATKGNGDFSDPSKSIPV